MTPLGKAGADARARHDSGVRTFRLSVERVSEIAFGVRLSEQLGMSGPSLEVARATHRQTARVLDDVIACVRRTGRGAAAIAFAEREPIKIDESDGVRLALILLATAPFTSRIKARRVADGVRSMSAEEAYYWYAKCATDHSRTLRALRVLLGD